MGPCDLKPGYVKKNPETFNRSCKIELDECFPITKITPFFPRNYLLFANFLHPSLPIFLHHLFVMHPRQLPSVPNGSNKPWMLLYLVAVRRFWKDNILIRFLYDPTAASKISCFSTNFCFFLINCFFYLFLILSQLDSLCSNLVDFLTIITS